MPRPRKNPEELLKRELRITPPDGMPITDWHLDPSIKQLVSFEEGGGGDKKLHYHCYIETTMTSQALPKWIYTVARCIETGEKGNSVFFTRAPHEHTYGYISKHKKVSIRHGIDHPTLDEWFTRSDEYIKQKESVRKREQRGRLAELQDVLDVVEKDLKGDPTIRSVNGIVSSILKYCHHMDIRFPARTQMETFVVKLLYPYNPESIHDYYLRSFPTGFNHS